MATRTKAATGNDWLSASAWVENAVPTSVDDVVFNASSGPVSIYNSSPTCKTLTMTGYANTMSFTSASGVLNVAGNIVLGGTITSNSLSAYLYSTGACNMTSNGITWPCGFRMSSTGTRTLLDNWTFMGTITCLGSATMTGTGVSIYTYGGIDATSTGTTSVQQFIIPVYAKGGVYSTTNNCQLAFLASGSGLIIDGDISFGVYFIMRNGRISWQSGTVNASNSYLGIYGTPGPAYACGNHVTWAGVFAKISSTTLTLESDIYTGNFDLATFTTTVNGAYTVRISGTLSGYTNCQMIGSARVLLCGTGNVTTVTLGINTEINTEGTITFSSGNTFTIGGGAGKTYTYTAGTVVNTGNILRIWGTCTYNLTGILWETVLIDISSSSTITLSSPLLASLFDVVGLGTATFAGSSAITVDTYRQVATSTLVLPASGTLNITLAFIINGSSKSSATTLMSASVPAVVNYTGPIANQRMYTATLVNLDASSNRLYALWGSVSSCTNIVAVTSEQLAIDVFGSL